MLVGKASDVILGPPPETPYDDLKECLPTTIPAWKGRARGTVVTPTVGSPLVIRGTTGYPRTNYTRFVQSPSWAPAHALNYPPQRTQAD